MSYSLNEIEHTAKRAARGAGYAWGLAEEAGKAVRWLTVQGIDGAAMLSCLLQEGFGEALPDHTPDCIGFSWSSPEALCPLITGAALCDRADRLTSDALVLNRVFAPGLLLPFAASIAEIVKEPVHLEMAGQSAITVGGRLQSDGEFPTRADRVSLALGGTIERPRPIHERAGPDPAGWAQLCIFAHRTYAPATPQSRLRGAGAGLSDND